MQHLRKREYSIPLGEVATVKARVGSPEWTLHCPMRSPKMEGSFQALNSNKHHLILRPT